MQKLSWLSREERRKSRLLVRPMLISVYSRGSLFHSGEQGKVEESMREMAAIEALKSEKADKEVSLGRLVASSRRSHFEFSSESSNN